MAHLSSAGATKDIRTMARAQLTSTGTSVRDPKTGRFQTVRGVGALKGPPYIGQGRRSYQTHRGSGVEGRRIRQECCSEPVEALRRENWHAFAGRATMLNGCEVRTINYQAEPARRPRL